MKSSKPEALLAYQLKACNLLSEQEFMFHATRRWKFDFAWPAEKLALEIEGGVWTGGRHTRGAGFVADLEKYNAATLLGWRLLRVTPDDVKKGRALALIEQALGLVGE